MTSPFKVMLATDAELEKLRFPLVATPKLDGIRAYVRNGVVYSRANKPIPNDLVQKLFSKHEHYDGELIVGSPTAHDVMRQTMSGVMSKDGEPDVTYYAFDHLADLNTPWIDRVKKLSRKLRVNIHEWQLIGDVDTLMAYEQKNVDAGYEGLILRDPNAPYKQGRSTAREGYLLKMKRFVDDEAVVIGFEERMHNGNEATTNELGRTSRSSHKAGKSGRGDLGALLLRNSEGVEFSCGTGFSDADRSEIWTHQDRYLGKLAKFKYFPVGVKEAPRHPVFLGWRDLRDV